MKRNESESRRENKTKKQKTTEKNSKENEEGGTILHTEWVH